jgi:hypothetical protein
MMRSAHSWLAAWLLGACALASAQTPPRASDCEAPRPLAKAVACVEHVATYPGSAETIKEDPAGARLERVGNAEGHDIFLLVANDSGQWSAHHLMYEQGHGKRATRFELVALSRESVGGKTVWRVDYRSHSEIVARSVQKRAVHERSALCAPGSAKGCVQMITTCIATRAVGGAATTEQYKGKLQIHPNGSVSVQPEQRSPGILCKPSPAARLW